MKTKRIAAIFVVLFSIAPAAMAKQMKNPANGLGKTECEKKMKYIASKGEANATQLDANSKNAK